MSDSDESFVCTRPAPSGGACDDESVDNALGPRSLPPRGAGRLGRPREWDQSGSFGAFVVWNAEVAHGGSSSSAEVVRGRCERYVCGLLHVAWQFEPCASDPAADTEVAVPDTRRGARNSARGKVSYTVQHSWPFASPEQIVDDNLDMSSALAPLHLYKVCKGLEIVAHTYRVADVVSSTGIDFCRCFYSTLIGQMQSYKHRLPFFSRKCH